MRKVGRLPSGAVDPDCDVVQAIRAAVEEIEGCRSTAGQEQGVVELLPVIAQARWAELFVPLAWPQQQVPFEFELKPWAPYHVEAWAWWAGIEQLVTPPAGVFCWFRNAGKSSWLQLMFAVSALVRLRGYGWWVGAKEAAQVDKVATVGALLSTPRVVAAFPTETAAFVDPMSGVARDVRQGRVATATFALDAVGMDQALRGALRYSIRPGLIALDDIEEIDETSYMRGRKQTTVTKKIIPAGSKDVAMMWVQNRISDDTLMAKMLDGELDWFRDKTVSGPWPQIDGLEWELVDTGDGVPLYEIVGGVPTWPEGAGIEVSTREMNNEGIGAFLTEKQHEGDTQEGDRFPRDVWRRADSPPAPPLRCVRGWDVAGSSDKDADFTAGVLIGVDGKGRFWVLDVVRGRLEPDERDELMVLTAEGDQELGFGRVKQLVEKQPGAAGKEWNDRFSREVFVGLPHEMVAPLGSKTWRADTWSKQVRSGRAVLVGGEWVKGFVREHALFPDLGKNDDQVDAASYAVNELARGVRRAGRRGSAGTAAGRSI